MSTYQIIYCKKHRLEKKSEGYYRSNPYGHDDCNDCVVKPEDEYKKLLEHFNLLNSVNVKLSYENEKLKEILGNKIVDVILK